MIWAVTLTFDGVVDRRHLDVFEDSLSSYDAFVSAVPGVGFHVVLHVDGPDPIEAVEVARDAAASVAPGLLVEMSAMTDERYAQHAMEPTLPELVSAPEVGDILGGISRQRVHQLRDNPNFPSPLYELRTGAVWDARAIRRFAKDWPRTSGRPHSATSRR